MLKYRLTLFEIFDELMSKLSGPILVSIEYLIPPPHQFEEL